MSEAAAKAVSKKAFEAHLQVLQEEVENVTSEEQLKLNDNPLLRRPIERRIAVTAINPAWQASRASSSDTDIEGERLLVEGWSDNPLRTLTAASQGSTDRHVPRGPSDLPDKSGTVPIGGSVVQGNFEAKESIFENNSDSIEEACSANEISGDTQGVSLDNVEQNTNTVSAGEHRGSQTIPARRLPSKLKLRGSVTQISHHKVSADDIRSKLVGTRENLGPSIATRLSTYATNLSKFRKYMVVTRSETESKPSK